MPVQSGTKYKKKKRKRERQDHRVTGKVPSNSKVGGTKMENPRHGWWQTRRYGGQRYLNRQSGLSATLRQAGNPFCYCLQDSAEMPRLQSASVRAGGLTAEQAGLSGQLRPAWPGGEPSSAGTSSL